MRWILRLVATNGIRTAMRLLNKSQKQQRKAAFRCGAKFDCSTIYKAHKNNTPYINGNRVPKKPDGRSPAHSTVLTVRISQRISVTLLNQNHLVVYELLSNFFILVTLCSLVPNKTAQWHSPLNGQDFR